MQKDKVGGLVVKSIYYSSRGLSFYSWHLPVWLIVICNSSSQIFDASGLRRNLQSWRHIYLHVLKSQKRNCKTIKVKERSYKDERFNLSIMGLMDFQKEKNRHLFFILCILFFCPHVCVEGVRSSETGVTCRQL